VYPNLTPPDGEGCARVFNVVGTGCDLVTDSCKEGSGVFARILFHWQQIISSGATTTSYVTCCVQVVLGYSML
jgi:hypothetical protein